VQNAYHDGTAFADIEEGLVNTTNAPASAEMSFIYQGFISGLMSWTDSLSHLCDRLSGFLVGWTVV
jgi:hypothetical protein